MPQWQFYVFGSFSYCKSHRKRKWLALSQIKGYKLFFCTYAHYIYGDSIISLGEVSKSIMLIIGAPYCPPSWGPGARRTGAAPAGGPGAQTGPPGSS